MDLVSPSTNIDLTMKVKISVDDNDLTWEVTSIKKKDGCTDIATIEISQLNLLSTDNVRRRMQSLMVDNPPYVQPIPTSG